MRVLCFVLSCLLVGCGLDDSGLFSPATTSGTGGTHVPVDAAGGSGGTGAGEPVDASDDQDAPPGPDAGPCDTDADGCVDPVVPAGWQPTAYVENPSADCPADFGPNDDAVTSPTAGSFACSCSCSVSQQPSCVSGTIPTADGSTSACNVAGDLLDAANGACTPVGFAATLDVYSLATPLAPTGGSCGVQAASQGNPTATPARLCAPAAGCRSAACAGYAPAGYLSCITTAGDVACPGGSPFQNKHLVGTSPTAGCSDCGSSCTLQVTCTQATLDLYGDVGCNALVCALPATGQCLPTNAAGSGVRSYRYSAVPSGGCSADGTSTPTLGLQQPRTVCCR